MLNLPVIGQNEKWFCVLVKPGWLGRVEAELYSLGFRVFTPKLRKWVSHSRRFKVVERSIIGQYCFVAVDYPKQSFGTIRDVRGVAKILANMGDPLPFAMEEVVDFIRRQMEGEWDQVSKENIPVGARIRVMEGPNANEEAVLSGIGRGGKISYRIPGIRAAFNDYWLNVRPA